MVETQATSSISHWVHTGLVVSGVEADQHQVDLVADDQLLGDLGGAVGVRLAVLEQHLDRARGVADLEAALHRLAELPEHEVVGLRERRQRPGLRADVAELDRPGLGVHGRREHRARGERRAGGGRGLDEAAARECACACRLACLPPLWRRAALWRSRRKTRFLIEALSACFDPACACKDLRRINDVRISNTRSINGHCRPAVSAMSMDADPGSDVPAGRSDGEVVVPALSSAVAHSRLRLDAPPAPHPAATAPARPS